MESLTNPRDEASHPPVAIVGAVSSALPRLVLLPRYANRTDEFSVVADANTTSVASCTSTGRRFRISFGLVPSPAISTFSYGWEDPHAGDRNIQCPIVRAAHGDCVLLEVTTPSTGRSSISPRPPPDYLLYQASAAGRPPSLLLLPPCYIPCQYDVDRRHGASASPPKPRYIVRDGTGILRRCGGDILVVQLELEGPENQAGELCLLRPGRDRDWRFKTKVPIVINDGDNTGNRDDSQGASDDDEGQLRWWWTDTAFAVGDQFLCWIDYHHGFLFADMSTDESSIRLRYVPLPVVASSENPHASEAGRSNMAWTRNLAAAGDGSVRFVDVDSRCCCSDPGRTRCQRGRFLFTVATWTMKLSMDEPMEWVKDGVLDCDKLWAQPGYTGLPRVTVEYPIVVDANDPDAVCFVINSDYRCYSIDEIVEKKVWTIVVDTRRKVLRSVLLFNGSDIHEPSHSFFPAKIQY